jgi:hypothetical protein
VYHGANAVVLVVLALALYEYTRPAPPADAELQALGGAGLFIALGVLALLPVIPATFLALRLLEGRSTEPRGRYAKASRLFLALAWLPTWIPVVVVAQHYRPWPLSWREGPDTAYAREKFEGFAAYLTPDSFEDVYYCEFTDGRRAFERTTVFVRFTCRDRPRVEQLAARLYLERTDGRTFWDTTGWRPSWWPYRTAYATARWTRDSDTAATTSLEYYEERGLVLYRRTKPGCAHE